MDSPAGPDRPHVLLIDDDFDFIEMMKLILRRAGFDVSGAIDPRQALEKCGSMSPDIILLDLMMPDTDGWTTYRRLREISSVPIIILSASADPHNVVYGLDIGAEDYVPKTTHYAEVVARIRKVLRQVAKASDSNLMTFPEIDLQIDLRLHDVICRGNHVRLLPREFKVLNMLAENSPRHATYDDLTKKLWGKNSGQNRTHLKTIIFSLRRKIEDEPAKPKLIVNFRSIGYQLDTRQR